MFSLTAEELHRDNLKHPSSQVGARIAGEVRSDRSTGVVEIVTIL